MGKVEVEKAPDPDESPAQPNIAQKERRRSDVAATRCSNMADNSAIPPFAPGCATDGWISMSDISTGFPWMRSGVFRGGRVRALRLGSGELVLRGRRVSTYCELCKGCGHGPSLTSLRTSLSPSPTPLSLSAIASWLIPPSTLSFLSVPGLSQIAASKLSWIHSVPGLEWHSIFVIIGRVSRWEKRRREHDAGGLGLRYWRWVLLHFHLRGFWVFPVNRDCQRGAEGRSELSLLWVCEMKSAA